MQQGKPEVITLEGANLLCYAYGHDVGVADSLTDLASHVQAHHQRSMRDLAVMAESISRSLPPGHKLETQVRSLPNMLASFENMPKQLRDRATEHRREAEQRILALREQGVGLPWWKSRAAVAIAGHAFTVTVSTLVAILLSRWLGS